MSAIVDPVARLLPAFAGLLLFWIGLYAALSRRRLDLLQRGLFVAGAGVALLAASLGSLVGTPGVGRHVAACALTIALAQAVAGLALARVVAARLRAARTDQLERLHG